MFATLSLNLNNSTTSGMIELKFCTLRDQSIIDLSLKNYDNCFKNGRVISIFLKQVGHKKTRKLTFLTLNLNIFFVIRGND